MLNPGVILLILIVIVIIIAVIALLVWASVEQYNKSNSGNTGTSSQTPCSQTVDIGSLIQIPATGANCIQNGQTGSLYYIGNLQGSVFDYVVAPWPTQPKNVCVSFCNNGLSGGVCKGDDYSGRSADENYQNCMKQLTTNSCLPPIPIAAKDSILYYAFLPTYRACQNSNQLLSYN
jgi:hypothetical protein